VIEEQESVDLHGNDLEVNNGKQKKPKVKNQKIMQDHSHNRLNEDIQCYTEDIEEGKSSDKGKI
jgi:hypothetical protein